ncbi:hypothetical protein LOZ58_006402 [Ophidiomyces ophidiicola]|nr:hypothetical protein LOZ58_006402 [Ophidiomyces ophidiicola]
MSASKAIKHHNTMPVAISDNGQYVAVAYDRHLELHKTSQGHNVLRSIPLHDAICGHLKFLQWSKDDTTHTGSHRLLCGSTTHISVFDTENENWVVEIETGDCFAHAEFTTKADGILCLLELGIQLMIFDLKTGEQRIVRAPKFSGPNGYDFRPRSGHLALIAKVDGQDALAIHNPETFECETAIVLQITDAQGLKWSPNGAWIACWAAALAGTAVAIYTADGKYFRTYTGPENEFGLGVKTIEWSPDSSLLGVGKQGGIVDLINTKTFTLAMVLGDPLSVPIDRKVYTEENSATSKREYTITPESFVFPFTYNIPTDTRTMSTISFSPSGNLIATVDHALPNILWIWSIRESPPRLAGSLVHKSNIKHLFWGVEHPEMLFATNDDDIATVHGWSCGRLPAIIQIPRASGGRYSAARIKSAMQDGGELIWFGWHTGYVMGYVSMVGPSVEFRQVEGIDQA